MPPLSRKAAAARSAPADAGSFVEALGHGAGDKRIQILRGIGLTGSISRAAREAGVSYKAAWQAVDTLTNVAGVALVDRAVGGAGGGGARLTAQGVRLLELADAFDAARREVHARWAAKAGDPGIEAEGRTQEGWAAGQALSRLAPRTSMRNQLPATVEDVRVTGRTARVLLRLDGRGDTGRAGDSLDAASRIHDRLAARITRESAELLGLREGLPVIVMCKATAVHVAGAAVAARLARVAGAKHAARGTSACAPEIDHGAAINRLGATVESVARAEDGDELGLMLAGGLRLVGFAPSGTRLRRRQRVDVGVDESALVVALAD
jgi:molybdate transport system regulatory protein